MNEQSDQPAGKKSRKGCLILIAIAVGAVVVFTAIMAWYTSTDEYEEGRAERQATAEAESAATEAAMPDPTATPETLDAGGQLACEEFRQTMADFQREIITVGEHREGLQDAYDRARGSENQTIRTQSEAVLRAVTQGDTAAYGDAADRFLNECIRLGH